MQKRAIENDILKSRCEGLEKELTKYKEQCLQNGAVAEDPKKQELNKKAENLLLKAKELLFEKTKINKRQEQQITALNMQIISLKDVLEVTKEMLEVRNVEAAHTQTRIDTIELRMKAEKEQNRLFDKKLAISKKMYDDLRKEYDCQATIFKQLRQNYELKNQILSDELEQLKNKGASTSA